MSSWSMFIIYVIGGCLFYWQLFYWKYDDRDCTYPPAEFVAVFWPFVLPLVVAGFILYYLGITLRTSAKKARDWADGE